MPLRPFLICPFVLAALGNVVGCDGGDEGEDTAVVSLLNEQNYEWTGGLEIPSYVTAELQDIVLDYSALTKDMLCHDLDPVATVDSLGLTRFPRMSGADVSTGLTNNSLLQSDTNGYVSCEPGDATSCPLSDFSFGGTAYDVVSIYEEAGGTFLLNLATGFEPGQGAVFVLQLLPTPGSDVTTVNFADNCDIVQMEFELDALEKLPMTAAGPWTIDWSTVSITGNGEPVQPSELDQVMVAHYTQTTTELEAQFLDLEIIAEQFYTLQLDGGTDADLAGLVSAEGTGFGGFTTDGTWLLALRCLQCTNPAPIFLTVVEVVE